MVKKYKIKGRILGKDKKPLKSLKVKAYDKKGMFISSALTDKAGRVEFESDTEPKLIKTVYKGKISSTKKVKVVGLIIDFGDWIICIIPPAEWHIRGIVRDKMSGDPIQGLTVEAWDVDIVDGDTYHDPLKTEITDATGEFNIWFDTTAFDRDESLLERHFSMFFPDVLLKVKNPQGIVIYEAEVDWNVIGKPHDCPPYCTHKGKEYILEIDYVTAIINKIGPVPIADINPSGSLQGFATYGGLNDRPFGGKTTISGRIWGAKVTKWKLFYTAGFIDSNDSRITGLGSSDADPNGFTKIAEGTNKIWDGPIKPWKTGSLEGLHTVILIVWDDKGNEFHDTQIVFLHNTAINPPAKISSPISCGTLNKAEGSIQIQGTASDDYFHSYSLLWAGCDQTELTGTGITYPSVGNKTPVVNGNLGTWDIGGLKDGPYVLRLSVHDRTIVNDGASTRSDYTWNTVNIASG